MKEKRRDNKGRILHTGESQRTDGKYLYKYVDAFGNTKYVYAWRLTPTDPTPKGKREKPSLRELEQQIRRDIEDGIDSTGKKMTLCQLYAKQNAQRANVKKSTMKQREQLMRLLKEDKLGARSIDTLTLRPDCLTRENGQDMIEIYQVKTKRYKKPISKELAKLLQSSIEYTQEKFGDTEYIFVNEKEPDRPMQYMAIKTKVMSMIQEKQLKDDHGELFGFGTHMFRHYYGVKLTEMHLDDWTIARLLGHKRLNNVQHYRKMSNQRMADETREVRQRMSDIIYMSLARWGEEYEQIRQDD